ncbi:MAG: beta-ketoacyl synthase chain length factor [Sandaracinaceae bacterium]|nr:beta-ketoacyl synthase chain length factor [Sandaracinaceae bacterium]
MNIPIYLSGWALWTPGFPDADAWLANKRDASVEKPAAATIDSRLRRGTSVLTRVANEVAGRACISAGLSATEGMPVVFGSAAGEIQIAIDQLEMMRSADGIVSPARFRNSVHNTATGIRAITTGYRGFTTALAAGSLTTAMTLVEVAGLLASGEERVLAIVADESLPAPLDQFASHEALGVAFVCERRRSPSTRASVTELEPCSHHPTCAGAGSISSNCAMNAAQLLRVAAGAHAQRVLLGRHDEEMWCALITPLNEAHAHA